MAIKTVRYSVISAWYDSNTDKHPQTDMIELGYKLLKSEPCSVADCWFFRVDDENVKSVPKYIADCNWTFSDERPAKDVRLVETEIINNHNFSGSETQEWEFIVYKNEEHDND